LSKRINHLWCVAEEFYEFLRKSAGIREFAKIVKNNSAKSFKTANTSLKLFSI
jgi:hypothetical protein